MQRNVNIFLGIFLGCIKCKIRMLFISDSLLYLKKSWSKEQILTHYRNLQYEFSSEFIIICHFSYPSFLCKAQILLRSLTIHKSFKSHYFDTFFHIKLISDKFPHEIFFFQKQPF